MFLSTRIEREPKFFIGMDQVPLMNEISNKWPKSFRYIKLLFFYEQRQVAEISILSCVFISLLLII